MVSHSMGECTLPNLLIQFFSKPLTFPILLLLDLSHTPKIQLQPLTFLCGQSEMQTHICKEQKQTNKQTKQMSPWFLSPNSSPSLEGRPSLLLHSFLLQKRCNIQREGLVVTSQKWPSSLSAWETGPGLRPEWQTKRD